MKYITLDILKYYDKQIKKLIEGFEPVDPSVDMDAIKKELQELSDKLTEVSGTTSDSFEKVQQDKEAADALIEDLKSTIEGLESIIAGNSDAIAEAQKKDGELEKALADSVVNISNAENALQEIKESIANVNNNIDNLTIDKENAAEEIAALKEKAEANRINVSELNGELTTVKDAMDGFGDDIAKIKTDLGAVDGLGEVQQKIQDIEKIVEDLEANDLTSYVKKEELEDGIVTTMVKVGVVGEDKTVNFYTKDETAEKVETALVKYVKNDDLSTSLSNYYTKEETPEAVQTAMMAAGVVKNSDLDAKFTDYYNKTETASAIAQNLATYTDNVLSNYSTIGQTSEAITQAVGDLNLNQYSTVTQTASAIETAIADFDDNNIKKNYYDKTETAAYVSSQMNSYVDGKLDGYSTVIQTADAIKTAIADVDVDGKLTNYYTKEETANKITEELASFEPEVGLENYYTKEETASKITERMTEYDTDTLSKKYATQEFTASSISSRLSDYVSSESLGDTLKGYSTLTQTASEIKAELFDAGLTSSKTSLTRAVVTSDEVQSMITTKTSDFASTSYVDQKADGITTNVSKTYLSKTDAGKTYATASQVKQLSDSISAKVSSDDVESSITLALGEFTVEGAKVHITSATTFDSDVNIKGNMTAGKVAIANSGVVLDENGLNFVDSKGNTFASVGRQLIGTDVPDGTTVTFANAWDTIPKVICIPRNLGTAAFEGVSGGDIVCYASNITKNGFKVNCYMNLPSGNTLTVGGSHYTDLNNVTSKVAMTKVFQKPAGITNINIPIEYSAVDGDYGRIYPVVTILNQAGNVVKTVDCKSFGSSYTVTTSVLEGTGESEQWYTKTLYFPYTAANTISVTLPSADTEYSVKVETVASSTSSSRDFKLFYFKIESQVLSTTASTKLISGSVDFIAVEPNTTNYNI